MKRIPELDLTKTYLIIIMIGIHAMYDLAQLETSVPSSILNILATVWCAPAFMFCMGLTIGFSRHQNVEDLFRRGVHLITIGMFLNVLRYGPFAFTSYATNDPSLMKALAQIFNVDILQFAGLAFMLLSLCKKAKMSAVIILLVSLVMNGVGTLLIGHFTSSYVINQVLGYFYHTPTCSCFPLLNWFIFVAAGNLMGKIYRENDNLDRVFSYILPVCGVIAIVHQYLSITQQSPLFKTLVNDWEYYSMPLQDALCVAFGVIPFELALFRLLSRVIPESWMPTLSYPSKHLNQYYCVSWVWIMWIACFLYFIEPSTTFANFSIRWLAIIVLSTLTVMVYNRYFKENATMFFGKHEMFWYVIIWIFIIGIGIIYFSKVPEPYIMPY